LIIDGEMCGYDTVTEQLLSKSDDFDVKSSSQNDRIQRCFCVYDILLYNVGLYFLFFLKLSLVKKLLILF
jgi:hypothetical protein